MGEKLDIEEEKIIVEKKDVNLMGTLIGMIFTILAIVLYIYGTVNSELIIYKVLASFSMILAVVFYVVASLKSTPYGYVSLDKDFFIHKEYEKEEKIPTTKIIKFRIKVKYGGKHERNRIYLIVRYIDDNNETKEALFEIKEITEEFVEIANKRLKEYRKGAKTELEEDKVSDFFDMLEEEEELEVTFIGIVKPGIKEDDILKDLLFITEDYAPIFFSSKHSFIDFDNIKEYKKYWIREAAFGGGEYVFTDSEDTSDKLDIIKINEIRRKIERKGNEITSDVEELKKNKKS